MSKHRLPDCNSAINLEEVSSLLSTLVDHARMAYAILKTLKEWDLQTCSLLELRQLLKLARQMMKQGLNNLESPVLGIASDQSLF